MSSILESKRCARSRSSARLCLLTGLLAACGAEAETNSQAFFPVDYEQQYTRVRDCRLSIEHAGHSVTVWASPEGASAYQDGRYPLPHETVLVKPLFADGNCKELAGYAAMRKRLEAWDWQLLDEKRRKQPDFRPAPCLSCHTRCTEGRDLTCTDP